MASKTLHGKCTRLKTGMKTLENPPCRPGPSRPVVLRPGLGHSLPPCRPSSGFIPPCSSVVRVPPSLSSFAQVSFLRCRPVSPSAHASEPERHKQNVGKWSGAARRSVRPVSLSWHRQMTRVQCR